METPEPYETTVASDMARLVLLHLEQEMASNNLDQEIQRKMGALERDEIQSYMTNVAQPEIERVMQRWFEARGIGAGSREGQALLFGAQQRSVSKRKVREQQAQHDFLRRLAAALNEDEAYAPSVPAGAE